MNARQIVDDVMASQLKAKGDMPELRIGDTINVHVRIIEGDKERIQVYQGVLIGRRGRGINETITVRRIVANEGVERVFPLNSPRIAQIEVVRHSDARRAKLYYLRGRVGKSRRLRDLRRGLKHIQDEAVAMEGEPASASAAEAQREASAAESAAE